MLTRFAVILLALPLSFAPAQEPLRPFKIRVVDEQTGRGVPLVELRTVNNLRYFTDSNGLVAFAEPGLLDQTVFFHVQGHGYEYAKDGFGFRGKALSIIPGGSAVLRIKRLNIAERLYRVTGAGIYADSVLLGEPTPIKKPVLNARVLGSDSVVNVLYQGKLWWFWGDTNRPSYPLGNFHVPMATSHLPAEGGLDPDVGVDLKYLADEKGFARATARLSGPGPCWITGLVVVKDDSRERLFATYQRVKGFLDIYERGIVEFDVAKQQFEKVLTFDKELVALPLGQTFLHRDQAVEHIYYANPYPLVRVRATPTGLADPKNYEAWTCLVQGTRLAEAKIARREDGQPHFAWRRNTDPVGPTQQSQLVKRGVLKGTEVPRAMRDDKGRQVELHAGSIYWNAYRKKWLMIAVESGGASPLGEVWYAEAETPLGPWQTAVKIVGHDRYSFYNPKQHPYFDKGRWIYFEGTYTNLFSGNPDKTPRYDYNQIMYKLDLDEPRLGAGRK